MVLKVFKELMGLRVHKVLKAYKEHKVHKVLKVLPVLKGLGHRTPLSLVSGGLAESMGIEGIIQAISIREEVK